MKKVAVISDISGFGKCSLTAAIPVISVMGVQACPLPTAMLSAQTGFDGYYIDSSNDRLLKIGEQWDQMGARFDGIYTGYMTDCEQVAAVNKICRRFRAGAKLIVDPVLGDNGCYYPAFNDDMRDCVRGLALAADIITPNLTELCLLAGEDYAALTARAELDGYLDEVADVATRLIAEGVGTVIVTGIHRGGKIGNLLVGDRVCYYECTCCGGSYSGTGDLFASIITAAAVRDIPLDRAVQLATDFIAEAINITECESVDRRHGVNFEKILQKLGVIE